MRWQIDCEWGSALVFYWISRAKLFLLFSQVGTHGLLPIAFRLVSAKTVQLLKLNTVNKMSPICVKDRSTDKVNTLVFSKIFCKTEPNFAIRV